MERVELARHHGAADEFGARKLPIGRIDIHHVGDHLVVLVPEHGREVEVDGRVAADGGKRVADRLEVGAVNLHVVEGLDQAVHAVDLDGHRVGALRRERIGRHLPRPVGRKRIAQQRVGPPAAR